jgi:hypothetical protein
MFFAQTIHIFYLISILDLRTHIPFGHNTENWKHKKQKSFDIPWHLVWWGSTWESSWNVPKTKISRVVLPQNYLYIVVTSHEKWWENCVCEAKMEIQIGIFHRINIGFELPLLNPFQLIFSTLTTMICKGLFNR